MFHFKIVASKYFGEVRALIGNWWVVHIQPKLLSFSTWLTVTVPENLLIFAGAMEEKFTELYQFLFDWWTLDVIPILTEFLAWFLPEGMLVQIEEFVILFNQKFSPVVELLTNAWIAAQTLLEKLQKLLRWILANPLGINIGFNVPEPLENESPIKFHTRLMDMDKWIKDNPMTVGIGLSETSNIAGSNLPAVAGGNTFYIDNLILEGVQDKEGLLRQLEEAI